MSQKFEYDVRNLRSLNKEVLNEIGQDGWQVVNVETQEDNSYTLTLMRELEINPLETIQAMLSSLKDIKK